MWKGIIFSLVFALVVTTVVWKYTWEPAPGRVPIVEATTEAEAVPVPAKQVDIAATMDGAKLFKRRTCFTCHGKDAETPILPSYPKLAGQSKEYALQQMMDIKNGVRTNGQSAAMAAIMHLVSDEEIETLAAHLETLERSVVVTPIEDGAAHSEGAQLFKKRTCFTCHGKDAQTPILPSYAKLAGQNAEYALQQMRDIKSGARANGMSAAMKAIMHLVSDEELVLIADYLESLSQ